MKSVSWTGEAHSPYQHRSALRVGFAALRVIRKAKVTSAAQSDGRQLAHVIDTNNTAGDVWADTAYRSKKNERWLVRNMLRSCIHHRKPKGKAMPERTARSNAAKSAVRARVEHVFAHQKNRYGLAGK